jgi:hypothetical protein
MPYHQVCHAHCPKGGGGAGAALALLVIIVAVAASSAHRIEHAAEDVLQVAVITVASALGLAALAAGAYVALRVHRSHDRNRQAIAGHAPAIQRSAQAISAARPAIEPHRTIRATVITEEEHPCSPPSS